MVCILRIYSQPIINKITDKNFKMTIGQKKNINQSAIQEWHIVIYGSTDFDRDKNPDTLDYSGIYTAC